MRHRGSARGRADDRRRRLPAYAGAIVTLLLLTACGGHSPAHARPSTARGSSSTAPAQSPATGAQANPITLENAKPGTTAWQLPGGSRSASATPSSAIRGYASEISVRPGDVLHLHVNTRPAAPYRIKIFRLGWYQGTGGRLIACLPACNGSEPGVSHPRRAPDRATGYLDAGLPVTDTVTVGQDWTSGYFVAKLIIAGGPDRGQASWIPFIVRSPPGRHAAILIQASVNTWEAYNASGGKSLYPINSLGAAVAASGTIAAAKVSFNRPFAVDPNDGPFSWEYQLVRFVERHGLDVSYQTDVDTDQDPSSLLQHHLFVVSGHDEYWSHAMRQAYQAALAKGVNLAFIGGNIGVWQVRYANADRTLIEYRRARLDPEPRPAFKTVMFTSLTPPDPQCRLLGVGGGGLANVQSDPPRSYAVTAAAMSNPWFHGTGLAAGDKIFGTVGYEWDNVKPGCTQPRPQVLLHFPGLRGVKGSPAGADAVTYRARSGAQVFSAGTLQLSWALDDYGHPGHADPRVQRLFINIFGSLGR